MPNTPDIKNGYAEIEDVRLYYERAGQGTDLVLIHAGCADRRMWDGQFLPFAQQYSTLCYDMRGYGKSNLPGGQFSNRQDLYQLLQFLNIPKAHFVACSQGSQTALDFALEHSEIIASLTLVSPTISGYPYEGPPPQSVVDLIASRQSGNLERAAELQAEIWSKGFKREADQVNPKVYELVRQMSLDALRNQKDVIKETGFLMEDPLLPPAMERLEQATFPLLTIVGDLDDDIVMQIADLLMTRIPHTQKAVIHGTAHLPNMEQPDEFNQIVLKFLNDLSLAV